MLIVCSNLFFKRVIVNDCSELQAIRNNMFHCNVKYGCLENEDRRPKTGDPLSLALSSCARVRVPTHVPRAHTCTREVRRRERGETSDPPSSVFIFQNSLVCFGKRRPKTGDLNNKGGKEGQMKGRREWIRKGL